MEFAENEDGDRVVCREQNVTGTRLAQRRICHTVREWRAIREREQEETRDIYNSRVDSNPNTGLPGGMR